MKVISWNVPRRIKETRETLIRIPSVPAEFRTENLPKINLEPYRYADMLDNSKLNFIVYIWKNRPQS